jgi:1-deoxy-D-xylulose-5-phosphate reductoisomerase
MQDHSTTKLSLLGASGSIGQSCLDVVRQHPGRFRVEALVGGRNLERLVQDALEFRPACVALADASQARALEEALAGQGIELLVGPDGVLEACQRPNDICVSAITGFAGLEPTLTALPHTKRLALANKESLVCGGSILMQAARAAGVEVLPVDSEHSAIFQALHEQPRNALRSIVLTASGGPFRNWEQSAIEAAGPEQALAHPNWDMGAKITVDSASLMNKALEFIEALYLFDLQPEDIEVVVHPQSIIHSMVQFHDGSYLAQLGAPDMRSPIAYALTYPERAALSVAPLDLVALGQLSFEAPRHEAFPLLRLAEQAWRAGPAAMIALNALNEAAVSAFLGGRLRFGAIAKVVLEGMERHHPASIASFGDIQDADKSARLLAETLIAR